MNTRFTSTTLLAAVTALGLGIAPAFAADANAAGGYVFPDYSGDAPAQQAPNGPTQSRDSGATMGTYATQSNNGTWLFPPNQNAGANS
jgi:hypothetical protein